MAVKNRSFLKNSNRDFDNILDSVQTQADHLRHEGTAPSIAFSGGSAAGNIEAHSSDVGGIINVTTQLANTNTCTVTFAEAFTANPAVVVSGLVNYTYVTSTTALTITANGNTGTGEIHYIALETA